MLAPIEKNKIYIEKLGLEEKFDKAINNDKHNQKVK